MRLGRGFALAMCKLSGCHDQQTKDAQSTVREGFVRDVMLQDDGCVSQSRSHKLVVHWVRLIQTRTAEDDGKRVAPAGLSIVHASTLSSSFMRTAERNATKSLRNARRDLVYGNIT